ncbi:HD-GYP domain-containing protein [Rugamonas apoptosis]|uniref:HD-GYP domain-containing protein n=1 Tax=Rugamonas apoptosis TaxID=2758570 RepID=A0A7W2FET2_9BURK|nr:HD-GYP domain-containing protein [Rugamonas apoptosis]MBA5690353.1 HD-GYP domain-containing protein [Rugamonas apoptosis]
MAVKLKKIQVIDLRLGMFLHAFDSSWLSTPFWRSKFLLDDPAVLKQAHDSGITTCWIDLARGDDEAPPAPPAPPPAPEPTPFERELQQAAALCAQAREATRSMFREARLGNAIDVGQCTDLVDELARSVTRNPGALISLARLKNKDDYTYMHSVAVCALMIGLGQHLGLDEAACREAGLAGLLHDLGKAGIPLEILNKPGKLTDEEFAAMRSHPRHGYDLLREGGAVSAGVGDVCLHHHEKMDGSGYPDRLPGSDISLLARMGAVCDVYDAITSNRPYKAGWDPSESVARMLEWQGHFDPVVLAAFVKLLGIYPVGTLVRLNSQRLAIVTEQNSGALTKPIVKAFYSLRTKSRIEPVRIDLSLATAKDAISGREPREQWAFDDLEQIWAGAAAGR